MGGCHPVAAPSYPLPLLPMKKNPTTTGHITLEDRTLRFAANVRLFVAKLPRAIILSEDVRQLLRASGSIGANYIEAHESTEKRDFIMRMRIALKEAKETHFWL